MSDNVVRFQPLTRPTIPVDDHVVAALEELLEKARVGEFNGYAIVTITVDGGGAYTDVGTSFGAQGVEQAVHVALGGVDVLKHRMLTTLFEF